jgi:RHS repeat-associated protein
MDSGQNIASRNLFGPFGRQLGQWGTNANIIGFSSMLNLRLPGLSLYSFRQTFDPGLQRFLNQDPLGESGGFNLYGFVGNNPISFVDPYGLMDFHWYNPVSWYWPGYGGPTYSPPLPLPDRSASPPRGDPDAGLLPQNVNLGNGTAGGLLDPSNLQRGRDTTTELVNGVFEDSAMATLGALGPGEAEELAKTLKGVPGTYKVCLRNGKKYVGKAVDIGKRLAQHVKKGKWKWSDIKDIFAEEAKTETQRRIREMERLMEETGGLHPSQVPNVLNERLPPKP